MMATLTANRYSANAAGVQWPCSELILVKLKSTYTRSGGNIYMKAWSRFTYWCLITWHITWSQLPQYTQVPPPHTPGYW